MKKIIALAVLLLILVACRSQPEAPPQPVMQPPVIQPPVVQLPPIQVETPPVQVETPPAQTTQTAPAPSTVNVDIKDFSFQPAEIKIKVGDTVVWTQKDGPQHTVTIVSGPEMFSSESLSSGDTFSHTFTKPGTYSYKCTPHPNMRGTVIVE